MVDYIKAMITEFPMQFTDKDVKTTPAPTDLFDEGNGDKLPPSEAEVFHTTVAKGLFACKRARPDIHTAIAVLCTRVRSPNRDDWRKLIHLLHYLNGTKEDVLTLSSNNLHELNWYVDSSFGVHPDFKSHTGGAFTYGSGMPITTSRKQK